MVKNKKESVNEKSERLEALMRILVLIVTGVILLAWRIFIYVLIIVHLIYAVIFGKRSKDIATLGETWNTQWYFFQRYILLVSNIRPFPFGKLAKNISEFKS